MNRNEWLKEKRQEAERGDDQTWSANYGDKWGTYPKSSHLQFIQKFIFTVEIRDATEVKAAFYEAQRSGVPVVYGEWINDEVYHYYPSLEQVRERVQEAGFVIVEEGEGDGYYHFLMRKAGTAILKSRN